MRYFFYILRCSDHTLYCGVTSDVYRRVRQHNGESGRGARYTRQRRPVQVVYTESHPSKKSAMRREIQVKSWNKQRKESLVSTREYNRPIVKTSYLYNHATVGGTFDHLHSGHIMLLSEAFRIAERVTVAITSDTFPRSKQYDSLILPYKERVQEVLIYLRNNNMSSRADIVGLNDPFGPALQDVSMDAIVVTRETYTTARHINKLREKSNLLPLYIHTIPYVKGNDSHIIRSSRIRKGEVNRSGYSYATPFLKHKTLLLPDTLRSALRHPIGRVVEGADDTRDNTAAITAQVIHKMNPHSIVTVGDIVYQTLCSAGVKPHIAIIDNRNNRKDLRPLDHLILGKLNRAGTLMPGAILTIKKAFRNLGRQHITIIIRGEEDLLALPAILFAPLGTLIIYGQYQKGIVIVTVTEEIKEVVKDMVEKFR